MLIERDAPSLATIAARIASRQLSPVEVTAAALDRLAQYEPELNAFITTLPDEALAAAREAEAEIARGDYRGPLHGVPISLKDLCWPFTPSAARSRHSCTQTAQESRRIE